MFDVLDWLGGYGPWLIAPAVIVLFEWEHIAPWLRNPWRNRPMSKRRLRRESLALVADMYAAAKERPGWTADMAEHWEMTKAMQKAPQEEWERPWDDRQRVELEVDLTENLGSIRERAREHFGVGMPKHAPDGPVDRAFPFVAFYSESRPGQWSMPSISLTVVDDRGRAVWNVDPDLVQFTQLLRSAELGALEGDPHRIYLVLLPPSGNGIFVDWQALLDAWRICWDVLDSIDTLAGVAAAGEFVRRKIRNRLGRGRVVH